MIGRIISAKNQKTVTVLVEGPKRHRLYKKAFMRTKKYLVHDEIGGKEGDIVVIESCRPISKNKHFKIVKVLGKDIVSLKQAELQEEAAEAIAEVMPEEEKEPSESVSQSVGESAGQQKEQKEDKKKTNSRKNKEEKEK